MAKPILCLDFDGVIHSYMTGWQGATVVADPPVPGALVFIARAQQHFRVAVFSSRSNQPGGLEAMQEWLAGSLLRDGEALGLDAQVVFDAIDWPLTKPPALVSLDDRALQFDGSWPDVMALRRFQPWTHRRAPVDDFPVEVDRHEGVISICGVRYDFDTFKFFAFAPIGAECRLIERADGVVTVEHS
ncbi:hypothetical protein ACQR1I_16590 [Bradyrhizobium sp. HKCCYLS2038]|uniref:hypothetical protein n=1 Tax=unclassified Bradyrhizobium TaxID=2631580 RepID=UPI003EBA6D1F